jgi:hypothetical protein
MSNRSKYNGSEMSMIIACVYACLSMRTIAVKRTQINAHPTVLWATRGQNFPPDSYCLWYTYLHSSDIKMVSMVFIYHAKYLSSLIDSRTASGTSRLPIGGQNIRVQMEGLKVRQRSRPSP